MERKTQYKLWLCGITSNGNEKAITENILPIAKYFDGLNWVYDESKGREDKTSWLLEDNRKEGKITFIPSFYNRFHFFRNHYIFNGLMKDGDWFVVLDSCEKLEGPFCEKICDFIFMLEENGVEGVVLHGKGLMFKFNESMEYRNSVHEQLQGARNIIEMTSIKGYENSIDYFKNRRSEIRDSQSFVEKYLFYYLCPNSIHCLLGCEDNRGRFARRQDLRKKFLKTYIKKIDINTENVIGYLVENTEEMKEYINNEKIFNDVYRKYVLRETNLKDEHNWEDMIAI